MKINVLYELNVDLNIRYDALIKNNEDKNKK
jgi:hypothetical protein